MQQNSLFNLPTPPAKPSKPKADPNDLFGSGQIRKQAIKTKEMVVTPRDAEKYTDNYSVPKVGETVLILNINDGIEGVVGYIDEKNLYLDHFFPIQLNIPSLGNMMVRTRLQDIRRKKVLTNGNIKG
jgi:hypothetical protein